MVLKTLWTRLSSLRSDSSTTERGGGASTAPEDDDEDETLSFAEQVEYGVDERDLSEEDVVLRLLVKRGGRVERDTILEQTGWSNQRLASVVDRMEDDNQVSAITVGRRNVVCRRGFEPKGYRSHLNE